MEDQPAIKVENLSKTFKLPHEKHSSVKSAFVNFYRKRTYETQKVLDDVSFEVKKGEFFGIVGRNGSGKSTLLKLLAGIYAPSRGKITVNGSLTPFIELGVGFNPELTGRENVYLNGALLGFNRKEMRAMYKDIVEFAELEKFMDQKLKNYSSGMQVRLAFSIAIRAHSDILLLDEVLAVGDSAFQRKCYRYFEDLRDSSATVVLVSHSMDVVQRFCKSAILLEDGNISKRGDAHEVADEYRAINLLSSDRGKPVSRRNETVSVEILKQTEKGVVFKMHHQETKKKDYYFGFSIVKDGMAFAELTSLNSKTAKISNNSLAYKLDISNFNPGVYEVSSTLFKTASGEPIAFTLLRPQFIIKGTDVNRGGALRLEDTWI